MKAAAFLLLAALLVAGCTSTPGGGNATGDGGAGSGSTGRNDYGNGTGSNTTPPPATPPTVTPGAPAVNPANPVAVFDTSKGTIRIELFVDRAPATAGSFINLTQAGFYDGQRFHRVIGPAKQPPDGFMDQAGDPNSKDPAKKATWGQGGPPCDLGPAYPCSGGTYTLPDEFGCKDGTTSNTWTGAGRDPCSGHQGLSFRFDHAGVLAMANTGRAHSGGSQFFITMAPASFLDGGYPIFGEVRSGLDVVKAIGNVPTDPQDHPIEDVLIRSVTIEGR